MKRIPAKLVFDRAVERLQIEGLACDTSETIVEVLLDADLRGHSSHGLSLLPLYIERIRRGGIDKHANPRWENTDSSVAILDANAAPGQIGAKLAADKCVSIARASGISAVSVKNNNHIGMVAAYRGPFQNSSIVGLILNVSGPSVVPPGGGRGTIGNNAICLIVPRAEDNPFIVDFATGVVACGKIREFVEQNQSLPTGWLVDKNGFPSVDPRDLDSGGAVPVFGGYKGLGLSIMIEILAGVLAGHIVSSRIKRQRTDFSVPMQCSQLFIGFNPAAFGLRSLAPFVKELENSVRDAYKDGCPSIFFPEQREQASVARCQRDGVAVCSKVSQLLEL